MTSYTKQDYDAVLKKFEYLDHTADIQLHSWGDSLNEAFEQCALAMFGYMTDIDGVLPKRREEIKATGHDMDSLLFCFLDELLFLSASDNYFMAREVQITDLVRGSGSEGVWSIEAVAYGEDFDKKRHGGQGTEIKAITYCNMKVIETEGERTEVFVIVDI